MKLSAEQLTQKLSNSPLPALVLLSGDEYLLAHELSLEIIHSAKQQGFAPSSHTIQIESGNAGATAWQTVSNSIQTPSLLSPKTCYSIALKSSKIDPKAKEFLTQFAENSKNQAGHCIVILIMPKIDQATQKTKWFQKLSTAADWCPIFPIHPNQLPQWTVNRATKNYQLKITLEHAKIIAARTENNLYAADQALQKLVLLNQEVTTELLKDIVETSAQYDIFKLTDACLAGQKNRAARILTNLKQQGIEPILITWSLAREIRLQIQIHTAIQNNQAFKQACNKLRIWDSRQPLVQRFIQRSNLNQCQEYLAKLAKLDFILKGLAPGDVWHELEKISMAISS